MSASVGEEIAERIRAAVLDSKDIRRLINMRIGSLEPGTLLVGVRVDVAPEATMHEVSAIVHLTERRVLSAVPEVTAVYVSPDIYVDPDAKTPATSAIVTLSAN